KSIDGRGELRVAADAPWKPLLEALEVHERTNLRVGVRHLEERVPKPRDRLRGSPVEDREVAVVERRRGREDGRRARRERALARERQVVRVEDARRVDLSANERTSGVALAADVVAVLADEDVESPHREGLRGIEAVRGQHIQRNERG